MNLQSNQTSSIQLTPLRQPRLSDISIGMPVEGIYRVVVSKRCRNGRLQFIKLEDGHSSLGCLIAREQCPENLKSYDAVRLSLKVGPSTINGRTGFIDHIECVEQIPSDLVLDLLPLPRKNPILKQLRAIISALPEVLRQFVLDVFSRDMITRRFCTYPASRTFHHARRGGILAHSIEMVEHLGKAAGLTDEERPLAIVAALLHDIGKTETLDWNGFKNTTGALATHDRMTLKICAMALDTLEEIQKSIADLLIHIWTAAYPGQYGIAPKSSIVQYVRDADRLSAKRDQWLSQFDWTADMMVPA